MTCNLSAITIPFDKMDDFLARLFVLSYLVFFASLGWLAASLIKRRDLRKPATMTGISLVILLVALLFQ